MRPQSNPEKQEILAQIAKLKTETYTHHTQREKHAHLPCTHTGLSILLLLGRAAAQNTSLPCPSADNSAFEVSQIKVAE